MKKINAEALTSADFEKRTTAPKILLFDIETSANEGKFWRSPWQTSIIKITQHTHMISWSAMWLGGKQITRALPDYEGYKPGSRDDKALVSELRDLIENADICVAHHGQAFDLPYTTGRCIANGLPPIKKVAFYDTRRVAKRNFGFTSNKLDDIARLLGLGTKIPIHYEIWDGCEKGDMKAWATMKRYNAHDTKLLCDVYLKFRAWDNSHPNLAVIQNTEELICPTCGSTDIGLRGHDFTKTGRRRAYECKAPLCGRRFSGKHQKVSDYR